MSFAVTAKLICVFVFAYAKSRFSHDAAHFTFYLSICYHNIQARTLLSVKKYKILNQDRYIIHIAVLSFKFQVYHNNFFLKTLIQCRTPKIFLYHLAITKNGKQLRL